MGVVGAVVGIWFQFPPSWRSDTTFRKKVKFLLLAQMFILVMSLQYWVFSWIFYVVPLQYQWILAFILIFAREINNLVMAAICDKGASFKTTCCNNLIGNLLVPYLPNPSCMMLKVKVFAQDFAES